MTMIKLVTCFMVLCMISSIHAENIDVELLTVNNAEVFHTSFKHDVTKMPDSVVFRVQSNREKAVLRLVKIPPLPTYVLNGDQYYPVNDDRQASETHSIKTGADRGIWDETWGRKSTSFTLHPDSR
ncbi:hypothetical protein SNE40_005958 [Patella caerulea]|uniref:Uncharacterized protein n=1 Tax=Patella caerulea TaxID=87958 RepID=A0AAN8PVH1_PATCE